MKKWLRGRITIAIDEAGRGSLAGPLAVASVEFRNTKADQPKIKILNGIKDSKKLTSKQREHWAGIIKKNFRCRVTMLGSRTIDRIGISKAARLAVARLVRRTSKGREKKSFVLLDGLLFAPKSYSQETVIKGDERVPFISAASIIAKVARDKKMLRLHKLFPLYAFDKHKGYGTKLHIKRIKKHGLSPIHRRCYCSGLRSRDDGDNN
jgi:ribonuclease HII